MSEPFSIRTYPELALIELTLRGCWSPDDFRSFQAEMRSAISRVSSPTDGFICLTDAMALAVQPQEIVKSFQAFLELPGVAARRTAFVTSSQLSRFQADRIKLAADQKNFDSAQSARTWLLPPSPKEKAGHCPA